MSMIRVVHPQLYVGIAYDESKIPMHICSQKADQSLCNHDTFPLTDYDQNIIVDNIVGREIIRKFYIR